MEPAPKERLPIGEALKHKWLRRAYRDALDAEQKANQWLFFPTKEIFLFRFEFFQKIEKILNFFQKIKKKFWIFFQKLEKFWRKKS